MNKSDMDQNERMMNEIEYLNDPESSSPGNSNPESSSGGGVVIEAEGRQNTATNSSTPAAKRWRLGLIPAFIQRLKPKLKVAAALVCCLALMLGSGFAGAMITEGRIMAMLSSGDAITAHRQAGDVFGNNGSSSEGASILGRFGSGGRTLSLNELFSSANPAVVAISTETTGRNVFGRRVTLPAAGSGFIVSEDGYLVTNNHVIENAASISVLLHDGTSYPAVLVGTDPLSDLAVLKIDANGLSYLVWGDSEDLQVGDQVVAIGNPLGEFANSMTVGYISALDREINIDGTPRNMLQTDAALNEGNSGGPLLNMRGQVVGIVSAKSIGMSVEGLGFAIPSKVAKNIINQLIDGGYVKNRGMIGVQVGVDYSSGEARVYVDLDI